ncbi:hypothetical protein C8N35_10714 [Breoghania corrubedonensis]|uniref:Uncharacterized protein n=1 Tax=Breoghania corrubedonensis TaxID=665038 RepID=A0A2T5V6B8_9HYPH|nr:hypothetical protein [Breoghania corrubedonensis]PTW59301.1 hypothetical protein C8N35_10714 [Breoghania corrubedonensis]
MQYLGRIHGAGVLKYAGKTFSHIDYDFDGFLRKPVEVIGSGEIRMSADTLRQLFGREDLHLLTDDGRLLSVRFSERHLPEASGGAHVDVAGGLPSPSEWHS